jgi:hypothetical protein
MKKYNVGVLLLLAAAQVQAGDVLAQEVSSGESVGGSDAGYAYDAAGDASANSDAGYAYDAAEDDASTDEGYVFGYRNGRLHASLGVKGEWTDNLYNTDTDTRSNFLTQISPSVWLTLPRRSKRPMQLVTDNTAVGGLQYSPPDTDSYTRMQAYLGGTLHYKAYSENSDLNHVEGDIEAMLQYKPMDKLTFQLMDKYARSQDIFNIAEATSDNERVYDSNMFGAGVAWYARDRFSLKGGYRNFLLEYDDEVNDFMNRTDNGFDLALYYEYSGKTNFFVQYQYLAAEYDEDEMPDNDNSFLTAGINWNATVKTNLMAKLGYQSVDYDDAPAGHDDSDSSFYFETQSIWHATVKSHVLINAKYSIEQSDSEQALNKSVFAFRVGFGHRFTDRLRSDVNFVYEDSEYDQFSGEDRSDDRWYFKPQLQFAVNKWLFATAYFSYDTKDSNYDGLDYDTTTIGFGVRGSF